MKAKKKGGENWPCSECGENSIIRYGSGWNGTVKKGENICPSCMYKRTGFSFFHKTPTPSKDMRSKWNEAIEKCIAAWKKSKEGVNGKVV